MAILLTGGTGKTSTYIGRFLQDAKIPFLLASRNAKTRASPGIQAVTFDWLDPATYDNPFQHTFPNGEKINKVYLVSPETSDRAPPMIAFIDFAHRNYGVKRFVLLAGTSAERGGPLVGKVWEHLVNTGAEFCVLRPTWFMENLLANEFGFASSIKREGKIYTACGDGKTPFVSAKDIGSVAFRALTDANPPNTDYVILGTELLSYDEIAAKLSHSLGRDIEHVKLTEEESVQRRLKLGLPESLAKLLAHLEARTAARKEEKLNDVVKRVTGEAPQIIDEWLAEHKAAFE